MIGREKQKQNGFLDVNQFLDMNPCNSKRNRGFFSNGKVLANAKFREGLG